MIPERTLEGLRHYQDRHLEPGNFLRAVLENDLCAAIAKADKENLAALPEIVSQLWNYWPAPIWGNPEKVRAHLAKR